MSAPLTFEEIMRRKGKNPDGTPLTPPEPEAPEPTVADEAAALAAKIEADQRSDIEKEIAEHDQAEIAPAGEASKA